MNKLLCCTVLLVGIVGCSTDSESESASGPASAPSEAARPGAASPEASDPSAGTVSILGQRRTSAPPAPSIDPAELQLVHDYTRLFYSGELDAIFDKFSPEMKRTMNRAQLAQFHQYVLQQYGQETELIGEETAQKDDYRAFVRWARFGKTDDVIEVQWILRDDDSIAGLFVRPAKRPTG